MSTLYFVLDKRTNGIPPGAYYVLGMGGLHTLGDVSTVLPKEAMQEAVNVWMQYPDNGVRCLKRDRPLENNSELTDFAQAKMIAIKYGDHKNLAPSFCDN